METRTEIVALLAALGVFFLVLALCEAQDRAARKKRRGYRPDEWLFSNWATKLYDAFTKADPAVAGRAIGVDVPKYMHNCQISRMEPVLKEVVVKKSLGFVLVGACGILGVVLGNAVVMAAGIAAAIPLIAFTVSKPDSAAKARKYQMVEELPRFIDLFGTALVINMPVEDAIMVTAKNLSGTLLAEEFMSALADMQLGVHDWQRALELMARKYEIDVFSDFVLDVVNSYNKGVPIIETVTRKSKDIKTSNLLSMKERASKLTSTILLPVLAFKVVPLLALLCIPIIQQITTGF